MRIATWVTAATLALGTIVSAQSVTYDFDKLTNFSRFKTYAWVRGTVLKDELNHARVVAAVNAQLAAKGFNEVRSAEAADVLVAYHASFDRNLQITGFSSGWGGYRFAGNRTGMARTDEIVTGTLAVDMVDAKTRTIVWRGMATKEIDVNAKPQKRTKNINTAVEKVFRNYPPVK
jgi:hypothetical protein